MLLTPGPYDFCELFSLRHWCYVCTCKSPFIAVLRMDVAQNPSPRFETLEFQRTAWTRWSGSLAVHGLLAAIAIAVPWTTHELLQPDTQRVTALIEPTPSPTPLPRPLAPPPLIKPAPLPPARHPVEFKAPPKPVQSSPRQVQVAEVPEPPKPEIAKLDLPKIEVPAVPRPTPLVKVGGFGSPEGAAPAATPSNQTVSAPKLGSFDLRPGSSTGRGSGGRQVAMAGFGDANAGAVSQGNSRGAVHTGGFGAYESANPAARVSHAAAPVETPVQITFKPKPVYTAEARAKKIEGEVLLEVVFAANGQIHVLRVMRGLGFGLDENAEAAASGIRFQPGTRDGAPVDMKGTVHIVFELS